MADTTLAVPYVVMQPDKTNKAEVLDFPALYKDFSDDELVSMIEADASGPELQKTILMQMAEECAVLKDRRQHITTNLKDPSEVVSIRVKSLKLLYDTIAKFDTRGTAFDFNSPTVQVIFRVWMERMLSTLHGCGVHSNMVDKISASFATNLDDWQEDVVERMKRAE